MVSAQTTLVCIKGTYEYMEMMFFYDGFFYSVTTLHNMSSWVMDFGNQTVAECPYEFFQMKT